MAKTRSAAFRQQVELCQLEADVAVATELQFARRPSVYASVRRASVKLVRHLGQRHTVVHPDDPPVTITGLAAYAGWRKWSA